MSDSFYTNVTRYGNNILWRGYENGVAFSRKVKYQPTLFTRTKDETPWSSFVENMPIQPKKFETMGDTKDFIEKYKGVDGFGVYGNSNYVTQFIQEKYPNNITFDMNIVNIFSFDIEVDIRDGKPNMEIADKPITSIATKSSKQDHYYLLGLKDYDRYATVTGIDPKNIRFIKCDSEKDLLEKFMRIWCENYPDIVTGWNCDFFDVQYVVTRIISLFSEARAKELSPWGYIKKKSIEKFGKRQYSYEIYGISIIDYMDVFKKFGYKYGTQESYRLDHIAHVVLGEKKLDYSQYGTLTALYDNNPQLYLDYNLKDTLLIQRFEDETAMLSLTLTVAYGGGVNFNDAFGTVGIWEATLYRKLMDKKLVPAVKSSSGGTPSDLVGGYVKEPIPNIYPWVVSFDLNSLYPMLMVQYNMSPETYISDVRSKVTPDMVLEGKYQNNNKNNSVCANGAHFSNEKIGVIPEIINEYYAKRSKTKVEMLEMESLLEIINEEKAKRKSNLAIST
jgi:DNA polymerase elongation subunit (family B)